MPRDDELDELRIRQVAMLRRSAYRARSYAMLAAAVCAIATLELPYMAIREVSAVGWGVWPIARLMLTIVAFRGMIFFARKAGQLNREALHVKLPEPSTPPDFSTLNDGSQFAKNLDEVREDE
jgi:hypothetical protein